MTDRKILHIIIGIALLFFALPVYAADPFRVTFQDGREKSAPILAIEEGEYISATDISLIFGASRYWRPDLMKMTLRLGDHRVKVTAENEIVVIDGDVFHLRTPVLFRDGRLLLPLELVTDFLINLAPWPAHWDAASGTVHFGTNAFHLLYTQVAPIGNGAEVVVWTLGRPPFRERRGGDGSIRIDFPGAQLAGDSLPEPGEDDLLEEWYWEMRVDTVTLCLLPDQSVGDFRVARRIRPEGVVIRLSTSRLEEEIGGAAEAVKVLTRPSNSGRRSLAVIDPGHGGSDSGFVWSGGIVEKDVTLDLAARIARHLAEKHGIVTTLTRDEDRDLPLLERAEAANRAGGGIFVSLHLGGCVAGNRSTIEAFVLASGRDVGERVRGVTEEIVARYEEEPPGAVLGGDIRFVPWDAVQERYSKKNAEAARDIVRALAQADGFGRGGTTEAPIAVLRGVDMPALLLEIGYGPGRTGAADLGREDVREDLARRLATAIAKQLEK